MKYHGSTLEFHDDRNADLMRAFRQLVMTKKKIVVPDIFTDLVEQPASRFWVSEERASIVVARIQAGKPLHRMRQSKREMFEEIYRRYALLRERHPSAPLSTLVEMVVNQPAPKFYLAPGSALRMFYKIRRAQNKKI